MFAHTYIALHNNILISWIQYINVETLLTKFTGKIYTHRYPSDDISYFILLTLADTYIILKCKKPRIHLQTAYKKAAASQC